MASFLFWNLNKRPLEHRVARLIVANSVDVLMVAECATDASQMIGAIVEGGGKEFRLLGTSPTKVKVFSSLSETSIVEKYSDPDGRIAMFQLELAGLPNLLLAAAHLHSRVNQSSSDLAQHATHWSRKIRENEDEVGHRRTVLVGDLNMNPFDDGVVSGHGLHAVMTRSKALEIERTIDGESRPFFYNPMWGYFGDKSPGPPGTYYYSATNPINYF